MGKVKSLRGRVVPLCRGRELRAVNWSRPWGCLEVTLEGQAEA